MRTAFSELTRVRAPMPSVVTMAGLPRGLPALELGRAGGRTGGHLTRSLPIAFHSTNCYVKRTVRSAADLARARAAVVCPAAYA